MKIRKIFRGIAAFLTILFIMTLLPVFPVSADDEGQLEQVYASPAPPAAPVITGVEDGGVYTGAVTPAWEDAPGTSSTAALAKDGGEPAAYENGTEISDPGTYVLIVTVKDIATELTAAAEVSFTLETEEVSEEEGEEESPPAKANEAEEQDQQDSDQDEEEDEDQEIDEDQEEEEEEKTEEKPSTPELPVKTGVEDLEQVKNSENIPGWKNMTELERAKATLQSSKKKLSTDLLMLVDDRFLEDGITRDEVVRQLAENNKLKEAASKDKKRKTPGGESVYVYIYMQPDADLSQINPFVEKVTDKNEELNLAVAWVKIEHLEELMELPEISRIETVDPPVIRMGSSYTEGDMIHFTDQVRELYGIMGAGVKVGVISDGVNNRMSAIASGDLPEYLEEEGLDKHIISDDAGGMEGTAILEIIFDMAPEAELYFHDHGSNTEGFKTAIDRLVAAGCDIIVDDIGWIREPFFEDGTVAQHVRDVITNNNIVYVSSAGNAANSHYQGYFIDTDENTYHDEYLTIDIPPYGFVTAVLQWSEKFGLATNDYDLYLKPIIDGNWGDYNLAYSIETQDYPVVGTSWNPVERLDFLNPSPTETVRAAIAVKSFESSGAEELEIYVYYSVPDSDFIVPEDSIFGHPAVPEAIAVGAAGVVGVENSWSARGYSSQGPVTIYHPVAVQRDKPDISGLDGVETSDPEYNPFYGTSAAAPHIAAIAALLKSVLPDADPAQIKELITSEAIDPDDNGYDYIFGHGRSHAAQIFQTLLPVVTGVEKGQTYISSVTPVWEEVTGATITATLKKDQAAENPYESGTAVTEDGVYLLKITGSRDLNGQQITAVNEYNFIIDSIPPSAPAVTGVEHEQTYEAGVTPTWTDAGGTTSEATLTIDGGEPVSFTSGTEITEDGDYILTVTATKLSNGLTTQTEIHFIISKPPEVPVVSGVEDGELYSTAVSPTWVEVGGVETTATLQKDDTGAVPYTKGESIAADGNYILTVTATKTSNGKQNILTITFRIDTTIPTVWEPLGEPQEISNAPGNTVELGISDEEGWVYLILSGSPQASLDDFLAAVENSQGAFSVVNAPMEAASISVGGLVPGLYYPYAVDEAGNISERGNYGITITDGIPPTVTFNPSNHATGIQITSKITISFNEAVRLIGGGAINEDNAASLIVFRKDNALGEDVPCTVSINTSKKAITISPTGSLAYSQKYYVALNPLLEDEAGNAAPGSAITFTTAGRPGGGGGGGGGGGSKQQPEKPVTPVTPPPVQPVLNNPQTADDQALEKNLRETGNAVLTVADRPDGTVSLSPGIVTQLAGKNKSLTVIDNGVRLQFFPNSLVARELINSLTVSGTVLSLGAQTIGAEEKQRLLAAVPQGENTGLHFVGADVFRFSAQLLTIRPGLPPVATAIASFATPVAVTVDLAGLSLTPQQIAELCGLRLQAEPGGTVTPVPLGGYYNPQDKTFTFYTDRFSEYTVAQMEYRTAVNLTIGSTVSSINGAMKTLDVPPTLINNRTMVPLRFIGEALGASFGWDQSSQTVTLKYGLKTIELVVGKKGPGLDTPPVIVDGRTLVPVRYISEAFGAQVNWYPASNLVTILKK